MNHPRWITRTHTVGTHRIVRKELHNGLRLDNFARVGLQSRRVRHLNSCKFWMLSQHSFCDSRCRKLMKIVEHEAHVVCGRFVNSVLLLEMKRLKQVTSSHHHPASVQILRTFWPSEKQLMKLLYLPWERKWRERVSAWLKRGRETSNTSACRCQKADDKTTCKTRQN